MSRAILGSGRDNTRSDDGAQLSRDSGVSKTGKQLMKSWNNGPLFLSIIAALRAGYMDLLSEEVSLPHLPAFAFHFCCSLYLWVLLPGPCSPWPSTDALFGRVDELDTDLGQIASLLGACFLICNGWILIVPTLYGICEDSMS